MTEKKTMIEKVRWPTSLTVHWGVLILVFLSSLALAACSRTDQAGTESEEWMSLFNGESLEGWNMKIAGHEHGVNFANTFSIRDSSIIVDFSGYENFDEQFGILLSDTEYSHYRLVLEYRFLGEQVHDGPGWAVRNSGIMVHSQSAESMLLDQNFPISIEVQLLGGNGTDERSTMNLCTPGTNVVMNGELFTNHCVNSTSQTYHGDGWVRVEVEVLGSDRIIHKVDGINVLEYESPQMGGGAVSGHDEALFIEGKLLRSGYIGLQSESHPLEFRRIDLLNLKGCMDVNSNNFRSYFVESDPANC